MLDRQYGKIVFECDACSDTLETGNGDFDASEAGKQHMEGVLNMLRGRGKS